MNIWMIGIDLMKKKLPNKRDFYRSLNMEDISEIDYSLFKTFRNNLELISDIDMLLMLEEEIRGGICHSVFRHAKANNKYMKDYDENKESSFLIYTDYNNLYGKARSEKLSVDGFGWDDDIAEIDENL